MLGAVAQFERDLIIERTKAALAMARKNGKCLGPPVKWQPGMAKQARRLMAGGELTAQEVANVLKVSRRTLYVGGRRLRGRECRLSGCRTGASRRGAGLRKTALGGRGRDERPPLRQFQSCASSLRDVGC